jgi:hypothetical protein
MLHAGKKPGKQTWRWNRENLQAKTLRLFPPVRPEETGFKARKKIGGLNA